MKRRAIFSWFLGSSESLYIDIPTPPTFSDTNTISAGGTLFTSTMNGKRDQLFSAGTINRIVLNGIIGTEASPYRFKSANSNSLTIIGQGDAPTQRNISTLNNTDWIEIYNLKLNTNQGGISFQGFALSNPGSFIKLQDIQSYFHTFASIWMNTSNGYFGNIEVSFFRTYDLNNGAGNGVDGGEGRYIGSTTGATRSTIYKYTEHNGYIDRAAREGLQFTSVKDLFIRNMTVRNSGTWGVAGAGQNRMVQIQYCNGVIRDTIFDGSQSSGELFTHGFLFINCYFRWANTDGWYIGASSASDNSAWARNGQPIGFINCIFDPDSNVTNLLAVSEDACDVVLIGCTISDRVTNKFQDNRTDKITFDLVDSGNTTTAQASIELPTYIDETETGLSLIAKLVTSPTHLSSKMGYRTRPNGLYPTDIILDDNQIQDGNSIGDLVGNLSTVGTGTFTYTIQSYGYLSEDYAKFQINGNRLEAADVLDHDINPTLNVRIRAINVADSNKWFDKILSVTVTTSPAAASVITPSDTSIMEHNVGGVVCDLLDDSYPGSTYSLVSGTGSTNNANFSISGNQLIMEADLEHDTAPTQSVRIRATNTANGSLTYEQAIPLTIAADLEGVVALFNLNASAQSISGYNDVSGDPGNVGERTATDATTGYRLRSGTNTNWVEGGGASSNNIGGAQVDDGGGFAFDEDATSSIWFSRESGHPEIIIDQLTNTKTYKLRVLFSLGASVGGTTNASTHTWSVQGGDDKSATARTSSNVGNSSVVTEWTGIVPVSGAITLRGVSIVGAGTRYYAVAVVTIEQEPLL